MGLVGKVIGGLVLLLAAAIILPKVLDGLDLDKAMDNIPGMGSLGLGDEGLDEAFSQFGPVPVKATQAHVIVDKGRIVHIEIVMEQTANRTFAIEEAIWLVHGLDAQENRSAIRDTDASMEAGRTNKSDLWRSTVISDGWRRGTVMVALHLAEQAGIQWDVTIPERLEGDRVAVDITPRM